MPRTRFSRQRRRLRVRSWCVYQHQKRFTRSVYQAAGESIANENEPPKAKGENEMRRKTRFSKGIEQFGLSCLRSMLARAYAKPNL